MSVKKIEFEGQDGNKLRGLLHLSNRPDSAFALFAHCFTCSKDLKSVSAISKELARNGVSVLRFDFTGLGESEGEFSDTNFTTNVLDLVKAAEFLEKNYSPAELLIGHSLGGAAVLQSADKIDSSKAVVTIAAPSEPSHVLKLIQNNKDEIRSEGEASVNISGRKFRIKKQFLDDLEKQGMEKKIRDLGKALLVMHAPFDNIVGIDNATGIFLPAKHPKSFVSLDSADHLLSNRTDARYVGSVISSWSSRYIKNISYMHEPVSDGETVEVVNHKHSYTTYIRKDNHLVVSDEPVSAGGDDLGGDPYSYLLGSLGSCTAMTLRMYAERKGWPLDRVSVVLTHKKIHASDCSECETREGKIDQLERNITVTGELSNDQRSRLVEIADKCPVHKTLTSETVIRTKISDH